MRTPYRNITQLLPFIYILKPSFLPTFTSFACDGAEGTDKKSILFTTVFRMIDNGNSQWKLITLPFFTSYHWERN